ncbi:MAG: UDP-N-acetylmuramoyl-L-alanine--D-glutamate ligase [Ignavibacteriaceae bacterium]|jgi:UDP-N-acetylmuramoylalanine--D-glutamate ligase|nr:UDP-N-acetylmuramoyl-L-alanine--D-glutamate ligase [Ignavibacteriaceae bacterium]
MDLQNKKITILGAERSGRAAAMLVKTLGGFPLVSDHAEEKKIEKSLAILKAAGIPFEAGQHSEKVFDCDFIIISPGVPSASKVVLQAKEKNIPILGELEFASRFCLGKIIAITGTNGKTTTTSLMHHVINLSGRKSYAAGNIGSAFSEIVLDVKEDEFVSLEVSSFQLDFNEKFNPFISMILNITPDHMNRYDHSLENYAQAKLSIFKNQSGEQIFIKNADDEILNKFQLETNAAVKEFSLTKELQNGAFVSGEKIIYNENGKALFTCGINDISLPGEHNRANAMAVIIAANCIGLPQEKIIEELRSFQGVEHRLEFVKEINGVKYVNDSKATNVDSVWYALRSFNEPLFLILGGQDKGNDYEQIKKLVEKKVKKIYAIGSSAELVFKFFHAIVKVEIKDSMEACVKAANQDTREGDIVLLSPACASFDMFENYEHRGQVFKQAVEDLQK